MSVRKLQDARFGRLTVIGYADRRRICRCDCGKMLSVDVSALHRQRSCGCQMKHGAAQRAATRPEYRIWVGIKTRCTNVRSHGYHRYGGRGIVMHKPWAASFETFLRDVGSRPSPEHTLDRYPNNDGNYEPGNVRWATRAEQARNTTRTRLLTFDGMTMCAKDWATKIGLKYSTLRQRLQYGWSVARTLTTPSFRNR